MLFSGDTASVSTCGCWSLCMHCVFPTLLIQSDDTQSLMSLYLLASLRKKFQTNQTKTPWCFISVECLQKGVTWEGQGVWNNIASYSCLCANASQSCSIQTHSYQRFTKMKHSIAFKSRGRLGYSTPFMLCGANVGGQRWREAKRKDGRFLPVPFSPLTWERGSCSETVRVLIQLYPLLGQKLVQLVLKKVPTVKC